jgi:hypothetical protein
MGTRLYGNQWPLVTLFISHAYFKKHSFCSC